MAVHARTYVSMDGWMDEWWRCKKYEWCACVRCDSLASSSSSVQPTRAHSSSSPRFFPPFSSSSSSLWLSVSFRSSPCRRHAQTASSWLNASFSHSCLWLEERNNIQRLMENYREYKRQNITIRDRRNKTDSQVSARSSNRSRFKFKKNLNTLYY